MLFSCVVAERLHTTQLLWDTIQKLLDRHTRVHAIRIAYGNAIAFFPPLHRVLSTQLI